MRKRIKSFFKDGCEVTGNAPQRPLPMLAEEAEEVAAFGQPPAENLAVAQHL